MSAVPAESLEAIQNELLLREVKRIASANPKSAAAAAVAELEPLRGSAVQVRAWFEGRGSALTGELGAAIQEPTEADERIGAALLKDKCYTEAFAASVGKAVEDRIRDRAARVERIFFISLAIAGVVGFAGISAIIHFAADEAAKTRVELHPKVLALDTIVANGVRAAMTSELGRVKDALEREQVYQQFVSLALAIKTEIKGIQKEDPQQLVGAVEEVAKHKELMARQDFYPLLEVVVDRVRESRSGAEEIRRISAALRNETIGRGSLVATLAEEYAKAILSANEPPDRWRASDIESMTRHAEAARSASYTEYVDPWIALVDVKREGWKRTALAEAMLTEISTLKPSEIADAIKVIYYHRSPMIWAVHPERPTLEHIRVGEACDKFIGLYEPEFRGMAAKEGVADALRERAKDARAKAKALDRHPVLSDDLLGLLKATSERGSGRTDQTKTPPPPSAPAGADRESKPPPGAGGAP